MLREESFDRGQGDLAVETGHIIEIVAGIFQREQPRVAAGGFELFEQGFGLLHGHHLVGGSGDEQMRRGCQAVANALGMPMPRSGNFADVYEFIGDSGAKWAIKCFTRAVPGLRERYTEIGKHLIQAKLPFTVDFEFLERGLRIRGDWYSVLSQIETTC